MKLVIDDPVDWSSPFKVKARVLRQVESGLTDRENRRALSSTLRLQVRATVQAHGPEARALSDCLRALINEPVAMPLWPAATTWGERESAEFEGGLNYIFRPGSTEAEVFEDEAPEWVQDSDTLVPLVVGYLENRELNHATPHLTLFDVVLIENSPAAWAITPMDHGAATGPMPDAYIAAPLLFPIPTDWDEPRTALTVRVQRDEIGFGREVSAIARDTTVARTIEQKAFAAIDEGWGAGKLMSFFQEHAAGKAFWVGGYGSQGVLHSDLPANATGLLLSGDEAFVPGDYLAMLQGGRLVAGFGPIAVSGSAHFFKLVESAGALIAWSDGSIALAE
jgi:hypothetical protein